MIELEARFPKRDQNSLRIRVDHRGLSVKFRPETQGAAIGSWFPEPDTAKHAYQLYQEYLTDRESKWAKVDEGPLGESFLNMKQVDGGLTRITYKRVGEYYYAQLNDEELQNLFGTLRNYFNIPIESSEEVDNLTPIDAISS